MKYLIDFFNTATDQEIASYLQDHGCQVLKSFDNFEKVYHVEASAQPPQTTIVERIVNDSENSIQLLNTVQLEQSSDINNFQIDQDRNWWKVASINDIDFAQQTFDHRKYGSKVTVYLIDSGIDQNHPEFQGSDIQLFHSFDGTFDDKSGHGTALASLINGQTCGLTNAKIKVVKIFDKGSPTYLSDILTCFDAIMSDIPNTKFAVINMSWSIDKNEYVDHKINLLMAAGAVAVAAAGNSGVPIDNVTPASLADVLTIGSYDKDFMPCNFSNYTGVSDVSLTQGSTNHGALDGWAPGCDLYVAVPGGGYGTVAGTSFSAAIHSGALAYDIDSFLMTNDGSLIPCFSQNIRQVLMFNSLSRHNILTLENQYAGSKNSISTYAGNSVASLPVEKMRPTYAFISGFFDCRPIVSRADVFSMEVTPPLPAGIQIVSPGWMYGTATLSDSDPDYVITDHIFTLLTTSGETISREVQVSVRKDTLDMSTVPVELVWIRAQGATCYFSGQNCLEPCPLGNPGSLLGICDYIKGTPFCPSCLS
jgi:hypothetical protein